MSTIWLTYAWADNSSNDVDFVAQELEAAGAKVKLDRWNIKAGARLWEQIEEFIQSEAQCDAWLIYATQASLGSEPCKEEYAYALDRALNTRGGDFPVIALFPGPVDKDLIPAGIRTRLYVSSRDPDWKERIIAAAEKRDLSVARPNVEPFQLTVHNLGSAGESYAIEVRPRAGTWNPFVAAIPASEAAEVNFSIAAGAPGHPPVSIVTFGLAKGVSNDEAYSVMQNEVTPTSSAFIFCSKLPSRLKFGCAVGAPQYTCEFKAGR